MKRTIMLVVVMVAVLAAVFAEGGVTLVSSPGSDSGKGSLEDMQLNQEVKVENYGRITLVKAKECDYYRYSDYRSWGSNSESNIFYLHLSILNTNKLDYEYLKNCTVKAYYDDGYVYSGWSCQLGNLDSGYEKDSTPIGPMYRGYYGFFVELPNAVLNDTAPLKIVVKMDDVEFTYYVRK